MMREMMKKTDVFYAMDHEFIPLPEGVMPWAPTFSPDGQYILFHDYHSATEWMVHTDGTGLKCITAQMKGRPGFLGGFYYLLDDKRMFLSNELGDEAVILECEPSVYQWTSYRFVPVDLSGDRELGRVCLGRRTYHMAPDGKHLAYNILTPVGLVMTLCTLERCPDSYRAVDFYCLNPQGPTDAEDPVLEHWIHGGTLSEFKSFCDGGRGMLFVTEGEGGNIDQYKCDLETGEIQRISTDPDWDEDGACSPDGKLTVCASWRGMGQLDVLNCVPAALPFMSFYLGAVIAVYYVSSYPGFCNDLQPWLLSGNDRMGQPLTTYQGGEWITVNNIAGQPMWYPDGTRILLQERGLTPPPPEENERVLEKGLAPNRLHLVKLRREAAEPMPVVETKVGTWAKRLGDYRANADFPGEHCFAGKAGGKVTLHVAGNLAGCDQKAVYEDFSDDGQRVVNGVDHVTGNPAQLHWQQELQVTDKNGVLLGRTAFDLRFAKKDPPPPRNVPPMTLEGTAFSEWDGVVRTGLPGFGPKTASLPKAAPLELRVQKKNGQIEVYVTANIGGDARPVCGAEVSLGGKTQTTNEDGKAEFATRNGKLEAKAGANFIAAGMDLYD